MNDSSCCYDKRKVIVDMNIYFSVIFGMFTILGVLITFYQFLYSQKVGSYLGTNRVKYLFLFNGHGKLSCYKYIIWMIVLGWPTGRLCDILKKIPAGFSWGTQLCELASGLFLLLWWLALIVFIIFITYIMISYALQLVNIASQSLSLDEFTLQELNRLDNNFIKKYMRKHHNECTIDCFCEMIIKLNQYATDDPGNRNKYIGLKKKIIDKYINHKNKVDTTAWRYIEELEVETFKSLANNSSADESDDFRLFILSKIVKCILLDIKIAQEKQVENNCNRIFEDNDWEHLILNLYQCLRYDGKTRFIEYLLCGNSDSSEEYQKLEKSLLCQLMIVDRKCLFDENLYDRDFAKIWSACLQIKYYNNFYMKQLYDHLCSGEGGRMNSKYVDLLDQENKAYLLMNLILYYSIYTNIGRYKWLNLDIELMHSLYDEKHIDVYEREADVKKQIEASNYGHRLCQYELDALYDVFLEVWKAPLSAQLLEKVYRCKGLNAFYTLVLKICVQRSSQKDIGKIENDVYLDILNGANKHIEIWRTRHMQYSLCTLEPANKIDMQLLYELEISLVVLVKINLPLETIKEDRRIVELYDVIFGQYVLAECVRAGSQDNMNIALWKDYIKRSYYRSNKEIETYCNEIFEAYETVGYNIVYAQKEDMKRLLYESCH